MDAASTRSAKTEEGTAGALRRPSQGKASQADTGADSERDPRNPNSVEYQLGNTLGPAHRHWRRAKFLGRFRLFYRFSTAHRAIVYAWVNDETTLRKANSRTDPTRSSTSDCARAILPTIRTTYSGKRNRASAELRLPLFWSLLNIGQQLASMRLGVSFFGQPRDGRTAALSN